MSFQPLRHTIRSLSLLSRIFGRSEKRVLIGSDPNGNRYFEESQGPNRRPKRIVWSPGQKKDIDDECPLPTPIAEWDSWLRFRRPDPPTDAEVAANARIAAVKANRGAEIMRRDKDKREAKLRSGELHRPEEAKPDNTHSSAGFPRYPDAGFEEYPGAASQEGRDGVDSKK